MSFGKSGKKRDYTDIKKGPSDLRLAMMVSHFSHEGKNKMQQIWINEQL